MERKSSGSSWPQRSLEQSVFLKLQKTADVLMGEVAQVLKPSELSPTQYNVLRILRAAGEQGLACGRISQRMLTREPDMTRLLDRLEARKLIARTRDRADRRVVRGRITPQGTRLLHSLDRPILDLHRRQLANLDRPQLKKLSELLDSARQRTE